MDNMGFYANPETGWVTLGKIIAITNQKGGVGKTTTAVNLSACVAALGKRVLLADIDPQGNATSGLGKNDGGSATIYDVLIGEASAAGATLDTGFGPLSLIPTAIELAGAEIELVGMEDREKLLRDALEPLRAEYDFIFIDCPPSLSLLTLNALTAADSVLIPIQCEFYALEGVSQLISTIEMVRKRLNPSLYIDGVILSMFDGRTNLSQAVVQDVRSFFGPAMYETIIPRNVRLAEAPSYGVPIIKYDPSAPGAKAYQAFTKEFLARERARKKAKK